MTHLRAILATATALLFVTCVHNSPYAAPKTVTTINVSLTSPGYLEETTR
jgi:hypothetical protein